jgi:predicted amidohydrolase
MAELIVAVAQTIPSPNDLARSVDDHVRLAVRAAELGAGVVLFPELSLTGYRRDLTAADALAPADDRLRPLHAVADTRDLLVIAGAPVLSPRGLHIGALCFTPHRAAAVSLKRFLHDGEERAFTPGQSGPPLPVAGQVVCVAICADITHPEHARDAADQGATIYAASCFLTPAGYAADTTLLERYACEHGMAVLMANYGAPSGEWPSAGRSAIWSRDGALLACGPADGEAVVVAQLPAARRPV